MGSQSFFKRVIGIGTERFGILKFSIAPSKIPTAEIIASVEEGIFRLDDDQKHLIRAEVSGVLRRAKPPPKNINSNVFKALISLKKDPDRLVLRPLTKATVL